MTCHSLVIRSTPKKATHIVAQLVRLFMVESIMAQLVRLFVIESIRIQILYLIHVPAFTLVLTSSVSRYVGAHSG